MKKIQDNPGIHNQNWQASESRLLKGNTYRDLSTVCIIATRGHIHARVLQSWFGLMSPMNQKFLRIFAMEMEVGEAYSKTIEQVIADKTLSTWKYILTLEEDNMPPPDGLLKLYEAIEGGVNGKKYDVVGGLYWTKGEGGQPMIYGNPQEMPKNFIPQLPLLDSIHECNGLGMGFNLFRMKIFKDERLSKPWFKTEQSYFPGQGSRTYTQDLYFYEKASAYYRFACDTRVKVGHFDAEHDIVW